MAIDYNILINKRVDENSDVPILDQILQIAVYDEFKAYEIYSKIIEKFGNINPFVNVKEAEAIHYSALIQLMQKYGVEVPKNDWPTKEIFIPNSVVECCELAVASEIDNIALYNHLLAYAKQSDVVDMIFRLQAASYNNHLPAFRNCVLNYYNNKQNGVNQADIMAKIQEYQNMLNDIMSGNINEESVTSILSKVNFSLVAGLLSGGAMTALLNNMLENSNKE